MRFALLSVASCFVLTCAFAQQSNEEPQDEKAQKSYRRALQLLRERDEQGALDEFKKADKQDGGHCRPCQKQMIKYGTKFGDWKTAQLGAQEFIDGARTPQEKALAHYELAWVLMSEAEQKHKEDLYARAHEQFTQALAVYAGFPEAVYWDGRALAQLHQDDSAKARFEQYIKMRGEGDPNYYRALRFISQPDLARARMAPPFTLTALDGKTIAMDDLQGKVVLIDFWATWCAPCREALPHMRNVAKKFQGEPLVILSISLDSDEQKWRDFVAKNEMTWPQYCDGGFSGPIARMFGVNAIPHTFTIDADGVLQDEQIGDASIEGKLKKLVARARELPASASPAK